MHPDVGFSFCQLRFGNGRRVEMLEPYDTGRDDFLERFLSGNGPGAHHVTFKIPDLRAMLTALDEAGYHPLRVSFDDPEWFEAFLHPKEVSGVVIQIAEVTRGAPELPMPAGVRLPPPRVERPATLNSIGHAVANLDDALRIFAGLLHGAERGRGTDTDAFGTVEWVELEWPEEGRIRLLHAGDGPLAGWLGGRSGRLHHVAFSVDDPDAVAGAVPMPDGRWEVPPERNHGVRLLLSPRPGAAPASPDRAARR
jgi:hypothetical protein